MNKAQTLSSQLIGELRSLRDEDEHVAWRHAEDAILKLYQTSLEMVESRRERIAAQALGGWMSTAYQGKDDDGTINISQGVGLSLLAADALIEVLDSASYEKG